MTAGKSFPVEQVIRHFHVRTIFHTMPPRANRIMKIRTQLILVKDMDIRHDLFQQVENPRPHVHEPAQILFIQLQGIIFLFTGIFGVLIKRIRQLLFHPLRRFMEHRKVKRRLKMTAGRIEVRPFIIHQLHQLIIHPAVVVPVRHMTDRIKIQDVPCTQPPDNIVQVGHITQQIVVRGRIHVRPTELHHREYTVILTLHNLQFPVDRQPGQQITNRIPVRIPAYLISIPDKIRVIFLFL